jgi:hypothetical protein
LLTWLDARNGSSFSGYSTAGDVVSFTINTGANGLQAMLPSTGAGGGLAVLTRNTVPVPFTLRTIKGIEYAVFAAATGAYQATYSSTVAPKTLMTSAPAANAARIARSL